MKEKINEVLSKNSGLLPILAVNSILEGKDNELPQNMSSDIASSLKFCPLNVLMLKGTWKCFRRKRKLNYWKSCKDYDLQMLL